MRRLAVEFATEKMGTMMEMMMNQMGTENPNDVIDNILSGRWVFRKQKRWMVVKKWTEFLNGATKLTRTEKCKDQETASDHGYFSGYKPENVKSIAEQVNCLRKYFPNLHRVDEDWSEEYLPNLPMGDIEGWFVAPRWERVASTYQEAVNVVLDILKDVMGDGFRDYRSGYIFPRNTFSEYLGLTERTSKSLEKLRCLQKNPDFLVFPAQFGLRHRGRSIERTWAVMNEFEFGLDAFIVGAMLLTHPERLKCCKDLSIDCAGNDYYDSFYNHSSACFFTSCCHSTSRNDYWRVEYHGCYAHLLSPSSGSASGWVIDPLEIVRRTRIKQGMLKP